MKKILYLMILLMLTGCKQDLVLKTNVVYELGDEISYDLNDYLLEEKTIDDYKVSLLEEYHGCGEYHLKVEENNQIHYIDLTISDTTAPNITMKSKIEVYVNDKINYQDYYLIEDLSEYSVKIHDDQVDLNKPGVYQASLQVTDAFFNTALKEFDVVVKEKEVVKKVSQKEVKKEKRTYYIDIDTYVQGKYGYKLGCEGVSLYMALKGKGYIQDMDLYSFMDTMSYSDISPEYGYMGNPKKSRDSSENKGKRTTIYPQALASWGKQYGDVVSFEGKDVKDLIEEIKKGHVVIVYMTSSFNKGVWKDFSFGKALVNNHALCLVGYDENTNEYIVNDCGKKGCVYRVNKDTFERSYRERYHAVVVR